MTTLRSGISSHRKSTRRNRHGKATRITCLGIRTLARFWRSIKSTLSLLKSRHFSRILAICRYTIRDLGSGPIASVSYRRDRRRLKASRAKLSGTCTTRSYRWPTSPSRTEFATGISPKSQRSILLQRSGNQRIPYLAGRSTRRTWLANRPYKSTLSP